MDSGGPIDSNNPALGVLLHAIGGLGAASFYFPFTRVRRWAWETYWLVGGIVFWVICPWVAAWLTVPELFQSITGSEDCVKKIPELLLLGMLWGIGNLMFGLSLRYLGISLGMTMTLGFCAVVGTFLPLIRENDENENRLLELFQTISGLVTLSGVAICIAGIVFCGKAGMRKEHELTASGGLSQAPEFHFTRGLVLALVAGVMSSCFALAMDKGKPLADAAFELGSAPVFKNSAVIALVLNGGAISNVAWCIALNLKNRSYSNYIDVQQPGLLNNYLLCTIAGIVAFSEFLFFGMGETQMGKYGFSSWSIHMAFVVVFSNMWGLVLAEWRGTSRRTRSLLIGGLAVLIASTIVMAYGANLYKKTHPDEETPSAAVPEMLGNTHPAATPTLLCEIKTRAI